MTFDEYMALDTNACKVATAAIVEAYFKAQESGSESTGLQIDDEICRKAIKTWGEDMLNVCMEEPAELIQAISKMRRKMVNGAMAKDNEERLAARAHLTEEIADVSIVLTELVQYYNIRLEDVQKWIDSKQARTFRRLLKYEEEAPRSEAHGKTVGGTSGVLEGFDRIIVETDGNHPKMVACITAEEILPADGYRVRCRPARTDTEEGQK